MKKQESIKKTVESYLNNESFYNKENSNNSYSFPNFKSYLAGSIIASYVTDNIYPEHISNAHKTGEIHLHDLGSGISPYCVGLSLKDLLHEGFNGIPGRVASGPPTRFSVACDQMANMIGVVQSEVAGALSFNSVDTLLAPYVKLMYEEFSDKERVYKEVKQSIQSLVYNLNQPNRSGEVPFSNFSFDWVVPDDLKPQTPIVNNKELPFTYGECQEEADMINKAFLEVMIQGDYNGSIFSFPIPTYGITKDFNWEGSNADLLFELTARYGTPYFQNFITSDLQPQMLRSMCCRLSLSLSDIRKKVGGIFSSGDNTGSIGVVTLNLPRIAKDFLNTNQENYRLFVFCELDRLLDIAFESLEVKRGLIDKYWDNGFYPYLTRYLPRRMKTFFSTIGINGGNEFLEYLGLSLDEEEGKQLSLDIINYIMKRIEEQSEKTGNLYNFEETPAEGASIRFATLDKHKDKYYTQGLKLPFDHTNNIFEKLDIEQDILVKYTGGSVAHIFLGEACKGIQAKKLIKTIFENYKVPYVTITPTFSVCQKDGYISGEHHTCPTCNSPTSVFSRIVGYYSPTVRWSNGKLKEFEERKMFDSSL